MKRKNGGEEKSSYFKPHPAPSDALSDNDDESKNNNLMPSGVSNSHSFRTQKSHPHEESKEDNDRTKEYKETTALDITNVAWIKHIIESKPSSSKIQLNDEEQKEAEQKAAAQKAAAQRIIRGFRSYKKTTYKNALLSRQEILKELESISQTAMKNWCFSTTAIFSFLYTEKSHFDYPFRKLVCKVKDNHMDMFNLKTSDKRIQKRLKSIPTRLGQFELDRLLATGSANCETQAIILRAYLINTLPLDILKQIGNENIMVAMYEETDHAFVVIKRFYGKTDQPDDCLVIDTWIANLYLPEKTEYRPEAVYSISHQYYRELLKNTTDRKLERTMAKKIPRQGDPNDHKERKPYMGPMRNHFHFLLDHADGRYVPKKISGLNLGDITFKALKNADDYNALYTFLERTQKSHPHEESKEDNDHTEESKETTALDSVNMARLKHIRESKPSPSKIQLNDEEKEEAEQKAAAQTIIRGFKSYKKQYIKNDLLSRQEILKELESISQTAMKKWCFSYTAINSFIWTQRSRDDSFSKLDYNYNYILNLKTSDKRIQKGLKSIPTRLGKLNLNGLLATGCANSETQAIILRAHLINTLPLDILKQIDNENIMVAGYKETDHAFVVIKRFYGKTDQPDDCLVIDTWIANLYLPKMTEYRREAVYPISHQYYRELLKNTTDKKLERTMAKKFPRQGDPNDHKERKPYMGRMRNHFHFLLDHADGCYVPKRISGLNLEDITFRALKNADDYNALYTFLENWEPD